MDPACDSGYLSAALILFGASHTFWHYPLRALFATRPKHPKPARTPASTPDPHHARSTTNPSNSLFYLVKLGTEGFCSHSRFCIKMSVLVVELRGFEPLTSSMPWKRATNCAIAPRSVHRVCDPLSITERQPIRKIETPCRPSHQPRSTDPCNNRCAMLTPPTHPRGSQYCAQPNGKTEHPTRRSLPHPREQALTSGNYPSHASHQTQAGSSPCR